MRKVFLILITFPCLLFSQQVLTIDEAIKIAVENNLGIKIAESKVEQAYYQKKEAKTYFLPQITSTFNYTYLGDNEGISISGLPLPPIKMTDDNLYNFTLSLNQPIFTGKKIEKTYEISKVNIENSKLQYNIQLQDVVFNVKKNYFSVLEAEKYLETARKYREMLEKHLENAKKLFQQGLATKLDILKTEVSVKDAETKIIEAENLIKLAKANLNFVLNKPVDEEITVVDIFEIKEDVKDYDYWKEISLKKRPEIKSMERLISIYEKKIDLEKSNLYPQIYFFTNYNFERGTQTSLGKWDTNWNTGIAISLDIWNWGRTKDKIKQSEKEKEQIDRQYEIVKKSIELEVKKAYLNLLSAEKKLEERKKQIETAKENLRVAELLYKEGLATTTDVIDAITSLTEAKNTYYTAIYEYKVAYFQLEKATGLYKNYEKMEEE